MKHTLLLTLLTCNSLLACSNQTREPSQPTQLKLLEEIENLDTFPSSEGNVAKLFHFNASCQIQFTAFHETAQITEHWTFQGDQITSAFNVVSMYENGGLTNADNHGKEIKITSTERNDFNLEDAKVQQNFQNLKAQFSDENLKQCI